MSFHQKRFPDLSLCPALNFVHSLSLSDIFEINLFVFPPLEGKIDADRDFWSVLFISTCPAPRAVCDT